MDNPLRRTVAFIAVAAALLATGVPTHARAQISLIRDAEIENTIRAYSAPLFQAAGLNPNDVHIHLVNDRTLNAFVAGGQRLFINTGLILESKHAGQLIGVIAHETGHIAGGHLARIDEQLRSSSAQQILALILGAAAAIGTGRGDVGAAVIAGGTTTGLRTLMNYTRTQESAADHAAMTFLDRTGQSARGLLEFMEILRRQELLSISRQDPYLRSHPLSSERVTVLENFVANSPNSSKPLPGNFRASYARMKAKLLAYVYPLGHTLNAYPEIDTTLPARYARAVGYYRAADLSKALPIVDGLIAENPNDPYFHELKGQMLFENQRGAESLAPYREALRLLPKSAILHADFGRVLVEQNDPALLNGAIEHLRTALRSEPMSPFTWRQLAIAYGRSGDAPNSSLALAEEAILLGKAPEARYHAGRAEKLFPRGSPGWLKAQDILETARIKK